MAMEKLERLEKYEVIMLMWKYIPPFLLIVGLVGNILVLVVLSMSSMKTTRMSLYLRFLAVFDILFLTTGIIPKVIEDFICSNVYDDIPYVISIMMFCYLSSSCISGWLLVSVTLERCFCVWFPHRMKVICTKRNTYIIISCIIVLMLVLNGYILVPVVVNNITKQNETIDISFQDIYKDLHYISQWIYICSYNVIPSLILTVCNICIIYKVYSSSQHFQQSKSSNNSDVYSSRQRQAFSLTVMLLITSSTYVLCTTPFTVYKIYSEYTPPQNVHDLAEHTTLFFFVILLMNINHSINFILYCVSGKRFRDELRKLLFFSRRQNSDS